MATTDERSLGDPRVGTPHPPVELATLADGGEVIRASSASIVVSGSGDGLVDAAAPGLIDGRSVVRYSASFAADPAAIRAAIDEASAVIVTDSNRSEARHWRSSQDTRGFTEYPPQRLGLLAEVAADQRLPVFDTLQADTVTVTEQLGPVSGTATSYGEPFAYLPEHRPFMAIDGDLATSWVVGEHGDPDVWAYQFDTYHQLAKAVPHMSLKVPDDRDRVAETTQWLLGELIANPDLR